MLRLDPVEYLSSLDEHRVARSKRTNVPSNNNLLGVHLMVQLIHRPVVLHVDRDLLVRLAVKDGEGRSDLDFVLIADAEEGADDAFLAVGPA